jgi:hypothetical protein
MVTGITTTRIEEIKKYKISEIFEENYFEYNSATKTGLISADMSAGEIVYYINNIKYVDIYEDGEYVHTYFECIPYNIIEKTGGNLLKNNNHLETAEPPKIKKDIFINRNEKSVFKENNLLCELKSILEIETFVGGNYFNIHKN